jgi:hypothetical protein
MPLLDDLVDGIGEPELGLSLLRIGIAEVGEDVAAPARDLRCPRTITPCLSLHQISSQNWDAPSKKAAQWH